jgi:hypothetical protein
MKLLNLGCTSALLPSLVGRIPYYIQLRAVTLQKIAMFAKAIVLIAGEYFRKLTGNSTNSQNEL